MPWNLQEVEEIDKLLQDPSVGPEVKAMFQQKKLAQEQADAQTGVTEDSLDPNLPMMPQVHATMPTAAGIGGADPKSEFSARSGDVVVFYEPPADWVRQQLMNGDALAAMGFKAQLTPEEVATAAPGNPYYDAVVNEQYRRAAGEAEKAGVPSYRYKDNDWLQGNSGLEMLQNFGRKLGASMKPASDSMKSFVLGVDDTMLFGALQSGGLAMQQSFADSAASVGLKAEGAKELKASQDKAIAENPTANTLGQVAGAVSPWGLTNRLANYVTQGIRTALPSAAGIPLAAAAGATTGATYGGAQLATDTLSSSTAAGQFTPPTPQQVEGAAMEAPIGAGLGAAGEGVGQLAGAWANRLRRGRLPGVQQGALGDLEQAGDLNISTLKGVQPTPQAADIVEEGFRTRSNPIDVSSERLAPKLLETAQAEKEALKAETKGFIQKFTETPEGRTKLPGQNYTASVMKQLERHSTSTADGGYRPNDSAGEELVAHFNKRIVDGVSTKPKEGAIELTPEQAEAWLAPTWQKRALPEKLPKSKAEAELDKKLGLDKEEGFAARLKAQGVDKVYVTPQRRTALEAEDLMDDLDVWKNGKVVPGETMNEVEAGLRADRKARSPEFDAGLKQLSDKRTQLDTMTERTTGHGNEQRGQTELQTVRGLSQFGRGGRGSKPMDDAMRQLADKAGMRPELESHASLDPMLRLSEASQFALGNTGVLGDKTGINLLNPLRIRSFPAARALGAANTSPIRQGRAARAGAVSPPSGLMGVDRTDALIRQQLQQDEEK